ncbi:nucleoplasmin-like protein ANO39 [Drosophila eugracilis]|uniref:nucleoplasmin-like protein ANO39 n=1 Tax=Drosophila eugracilis TaxID=29029 RepID=UPI001BD987D6|nr:nucleoplasmin-like protein ANO39 [Drosophila eugracilis]
MVRPIYLALVALFVLTCSVSAAPLGESEKEIIHDLPVSKQDPEIQNSSADTSEDDDEEEDEVQKVADESKEDDDDEDDDAEDDDDESLIRRRREAEATEEPSEETATETPTEDQKVDATTGTAPTRKPVLVLIRDALKKVTTDLPTAQVANNALQYFQQFEHFIQQAIEEVIGDDDDEEETPATVLPETETTIEDIKKPEGENSEKIPEVEVPAVVPEKETQAMEPMKMEESTSSTSAPNSNAV